MTLEQRTLPGKDNAEDVKELMEAAMSAREEDWRIFRHGVPTEEVAQRILEEMKNCAAQEEPSKDEAHEVDAPRDDLKPSGGNVAPTACADTESGFPSKGDQEVWDVVYTARKPLKIQDKGSFS